MMNKLNSNIVELELTPNKLLSFDALERVVHQLVNGGLCILPTETGYLLAANAFDEEAIKKVFLAKGRSFNNPIHVIVSGMKMADELVFLPPEARKLCYKFFPGPLTVICPKKDFISDFLVAHTGNLGIRSADSSVTYQIVEAFGKPITATSLNLSGFSNENNIIDTINLMNWGNQTVLFVRNDKDIKYSKPSTLVTFATKPWSILREGPISSDEIKNAMSQLYYSEFEDWT